MPRCKQSYAPFSKAMQARWEKTAAPSIEDMQPVPPLLPEPTTSATPHAGSSTSTTPQPVPSTSATSEPGSSTPAPSQPGSSSATPHPGPSMSTPQPGPSTSTTSQPGPSTTATPQPGPSTSATSQALSFVYGIPLSVPPPNISSDPLPPIPKPRNHQKISLYQEYYPQVEETGEVTRTVLELKQFKAFFGDMVCPECYHLGDFSVNSSTLLGLAIKWTIVCNHCNKTVSSHFTSSRNAASESLPQPFVTNEACLLASLLSGMGPYHFTNFCEYSEMPGLHQKTFNRMAMRIYSQNEKLGLEIFQQAAHIVRQEQAKQYGLTPADEDTVIDIAVGFDGSWLTRGHKSLIGIGCVIAVLTGLVLDGHVMRLHCQLCAQTGAWIERGNPTKLQEWKPKHKESGECTKNFDGTSGMMEVKASEVWWRRSVDKYKLRYTTLVSHGDSKAFNKLFLEIQPYGTSVEDVKEDCLNHVGKRLGTALRNLVSDCSKRGVTLGGRGYGRLTAKTIWKLQIYYSRAIRGAQSVEEMRNAINASIFHNYSTDDWLQHQYCPLGRTSWCFYKKTAAEYAYPGGHRKRIHTPLNYDLLHKHLEPIYRRLSAEDLLKRCLRKATQNTNESFHHSVWSRCNKKNFHSLKRVEFALITAAAEYNSGPSAIPTIKKCLGFESGEYGHKHGQMIGKKRLFKSTLESTDQAKKRRKMRPEAREKARKEKKEEEGGPAYQAGLY